MNDSIQMVCLFKVLKKVLIRSCAVGVLTMSVARAEDCVLRLVRRDLPPASNAYTLWTNALPQLRLPDDDGLRNGFRLASNLSTNMPEGDARRQLDAWLESKRDALKLLQQGIALGRLQLPAFVFDDFTKFDFAVIVRPRVPR